MAIKVFIKLNCFILKLFSQNLPFNIGNCGYCECLQITKYLGIAILFFAFS